MVGKWFGFERLEVFEEGLSSFERGDFEEAAQAFEACQADDPSDNRLKSYLIACYEQMAKAALDKERYVQAAAMAESGIVLNAKITDLHLLAAKAFKSIQKLSLANFHLRRALGLPTRLKEPAFR